MRKGYDFLKSLLFLLWVGNVKLMHAYLKRKQTLKKIYRVALMFPILPSHRHLKGKQCNISVYIPPAFKYMWQYFYINGKEQL